MGRIWGDINLSRNLRAGKTVRIIKKGESVFYLPHTFLDI